MTSLHRSISCPQLTSVFYDLQTTRPLSPQTTSLGEHNDNDLLLSNSDWHDRYLESQWRLSSAMQDLLDTVQNMSLFNHIHHHYHNHHCHHHPDRSLSRVFRHTLLCPAISTPPSHHHRTPRLKLNRSTLYRTMLFTTLLFYDTFSLMHQSLVRRWINHRTSNKSCRRWLHQFASSLDNLPLSTWLQRSALVVYIIRFVVK